MKLCKNVRISLVIFLFFSGLAFAETKENTPDNFGISNLNDPQTALKAKITGFLDDYIVCMAGVKDSISLCRFTSSSKHCEKLFYLMHVFYRELILTKNISSAAIMAYLKVEKKETLKDAQDYAAAFLAHDATMCSSDENKHNVRYCQALITRNPSLCEDKLCSDRVNYILAIENSDPKKCKSINNLSLRMLCEGDMTLDENSCKECSSFKTFIKSK